jgi:hypothetical protein
LDPLRRDDVVRARTASPSEKAAQTLELVRAGIELKRAGLRARYPELSPAELELRISAWLARDGERHD